MRTAVSYITSAILHSAALYVLAVYAPRHMEWEFAVDSGDAIMLSASQTASPPPMPAVEIEVIEIASTHQLVTTTAKVEPVEAPPDKQPTEPPVEIVPQGELPTPAPSPIEAIAVERQVAQALQSSNVANSSPKAPPSTQRNQRVVPTNTATASLVQSPARDAGASVDHPPRKMPTNPAPDYPYEARIARIEGQVLLKAEINELGLVAALSLHKSSGHAMLDDSALRAVRAWKFYPASSDGLAVATAVIVPVRFSIRDRQF
jgi:protein TonB